MLLLSSATRILATERPPTNLCAPLPHLARGHTEWPAHNYWSIRWTGRQSQQGARVSEVNTIVLVSPGPNWRQNAHGVRPLPAAPRGVSPDLRPALNSPGNDFSQAFLFLARRFFPVVSIGSILRCVLSRRPVRLSRTRGLARRRWRRIRFGRGVGGTCCRRTARGILRRCWRVCIRLRRRFLFASLRCWSHTLRAACCPAASRRHRRHDSQSRGAAASRWAPACQNISSRIALRLWSHRRF